MPRLRKSTMLLCYARSIKKEDTLDAGIMEVDVEEWEGVGLCVHNYYDSVKSNWRISHMKSGRSILRHMLTRRDAVQYLVRIHKWRDPQGRAVDWNMTEERYLTMGNRVEIKDMLLALQKEISGVVR